MKLNAIASKWVNSEGCQALLASSGLILFFEFISILNRQWLIKPMTLPYPTDFMRDVIHGLYLETALSVLIGSLLGLLLFTWYRGGLSRIISHAVLCFLSGLVGAVVITTLIFNAWMHIHLTTMGQWIDILSSLKAHTRPFHRFLFSIGVGITLPMYALIAWLYEHLRQDNKVLGHAHFSTGFETNRAGFFKREAQSIMIGKYAGAPLYANGFEHVLVFAPSGSGKTRSIAVPNLFNYP